MVWYRSLRRHDRRLAPEALAAKVGRQTKKIIAGWADDLRGYPAGARACLFVIVFERDCANEVGEALAGEMIPQFLVWPLCSSLKRI